jgi:NAD(P)-dependent dehydrogenase (short-subunit alcohol dehydrogenase family)
MDRVIDINVRGAMATTQPALKHMKNGGRIMMPKPTHTRVSRLPMKRLGAPDEIAETIVFTGPID